MVWSYAMGAQAFVRLCGRACLPQLFPGIVESMAFRGGGSSIAPSVWARSVRMGRALDSGSVRMGASVHAEAGIFHK